MMTEDQEPPDGEVVHSLIERHRAAFAALQGQVGIADRLDDDSPEWAAEQLEASRLEDEFERTAIAMTTVPLAGCGDNPDSAEIRIRDNGTGIPLEVKDRIFNSFFTTKPAGEGTGLDLSLSHDIVVKQHAGTIEVDTRPGEFTEFKIVLPHAAATLAKSRGGT
jgi:signal transduction histidine kinase